MSEQPEEGHSGSSQARYAIPVLHVSHRDERMMRRQVPCFDRAWRAALVRCVTSFALGGETKYSAVGRLMYDLSRPGLP